MPGREETSIGAKIAVAPSRKSVFENTKSLPANQTLPENVTNLRRL
jgi:hypothetical protein